MPPWGGPSGGSRGRNLRGGEQELWDLGGQRSRFQEVDSDGDDLLGLNKVNKRLIGNKLRLGKTRRGYDEGLAYGEDYGYSEDFPRHYYDDPVSRRQEWLREKEEKLVEAAVRRISRAKLRGEADVDLSREELDALERRQLVPHVPRQRVPLDRFISSVPSGSSARIDQNRRKASGSISRSSRSRNTSGEEATISHSAIATHSSNRLTQKATRPPGQTSRSRSRSHNGLSTSASRSGLPLDRQAQQPTSYPADEYEARDRNRPQYSRRPLSRGSPTRSLPDDPDWARHTRSSSAMQLRATDADPYIYQYPRGAQQTQRRNFSGPAGVAYSVPRRPVPPPMRHTAAAEAVPNQGYRSASGLSNEVIEISSDEDHPENSDEDEDESEVEGVRHDPVEHDDSSDEDEDSGIDDGVKVNVVPGNTTAKGYVVNQARKVAVPAAVSASTSAPVAPAARKLRKVRK